MILSRMTSARRRSLIATLAETTFPHSSSQLRRRVITITSQSTRQDPPHILNSFPHLIQKAFNKVNSSPSIHSLNSLYLLILLAPTNNLFIQNPQVHKKVLSYFQRSTINSQSNPSKKKSIIPPQSYMHRSLNTIIPHHPSTASLRLPPILHHQPSQLM